MSIDRGDPGISLVAAGHLKARTVMKSCLESLGPETLNIRRACKWGTRAKTSRGVVAENRQCRSSLEALAMVATWDYLGYQCTSRRCQRYLCGAISSAYLKHKSHRRFCQPLSGRANICRDAHLNGRASCARTGGVLLRCEL
jgi:hypothetical protein